ncbi:LysR family transcriptional regulator [Ameyamaea chiangmaiensis NBRC 103196]|uniref:LysR family transcriptional regulator n=1 Tax=Ameyamaea chiangmaiensis TaxID=442969 RepID=A0A850P4G3_9PROT|nr:LysR family transcriptional regulator [Ameyamaea chiangmaiensis]MBS4076148.1 LysR family transcriptional regulator [Ameyamaea chiangmaiensis]NVN39535.1 LysR family transcriptional regulator [Ameyamaea chiangmaiensis]GBQ64361.1 LysR family transcriptional regulator [Ameyamaea chiangmaiensis NBRC 103196]
MELSQLKTFVQVASSGSLSKAGAVLRTAQPALSRQIRLLEEELGIRLFDRHGRGMALTDAGRQVLQDAGRVLTAVDQLKENISYTQSRLSGTVTLGLPPTLSDIISVPLIIEAKEKHPELKIHLIDSYTGYLLEYLMKGEIDCAILYDPRGTHPLRSEFLANEELFLVSPYDPQIECGDTIPFHQALPLVTLLPSRQHGLRRILDDLASRVSLEFTPQVEADSFPALKDLVVRGFGYTILPIASLHHEIHENKMSIRRIENPSPRRRLFLSYPPNKPANRNVNFVSEVIKKLVTKSTNAGTFPQLR